jgi:hypothetical protein
VLHPLAVRHVPLLLQRPHDVGQVLAAARGQMLARDGQERAPKLRPSWVLQPGQTLHALRQHARRPADARRAAGRALLPRLQLLLRQRGHQLLPQQLGARSHHGAQAVPQQLLHGRLLLLLRRRDERIARQLLLLLPLLLLVWPQGRDVKLGERPQRLADTHDSRRLLLLLMVLWEVRVLLVLLVLCCCQLQLRLQLLVQAMQQPRQKGGKRVLLLLLAVCGRDSRQ